MNTSLDSTVTFTCEATDVLLLHFYVDGVPASYSVIIDRGFIELHQITNKTITRRSLSADAQKTNNNTNISCITLPGNIRSENATLRIQGRALRYFQ